MSSVSSTVVGILYGASEAVTNVGDLIEKRRQKRRREGMGMKARGARGRRGSFSEEMLDAANNNYTCVAGYHAETVSSHVVVTLRDKRIGECRRVTWCFFVRAWELL